MRVGLYVPLHGNSTVFGFDDTPTLGTQALPTFRQFTRRWAPSPRCRPGPSLRKPVLVNGTNSPAGNCLGRLLPAEGMGRSLISNLEVARARVRGKTSAGEGADVTRDGAAPHRAVGHPVERDGSPSTPARAVGERASETPSFRHRSGGAGGAGRAEVTVQGCRGSCQAVPIRIRHSGVGGEPSLPSAQNHRSALM